MVWASKRVQIPTAKTDVMVESLRSGIRAPCGRNGLRARDPETVSGRCLLIWMNAEDCCEALGLSSS